MGFQTRVNRNQPPAVAGDYASINPRAVMLAGPGIFKAPAAGVVVGRFCWADPDTGDVTQGQTSGYLLGFLHRENQAVIQTVNGEATMIVPQGIMISLFTQGDFWGYFAGGATPGQSVYAHTGSGNAALAGTLFAAAAGSPPANTVDTGFKVNSVSKVPAVVTAAIAATGVMTVSGVTSGVLEPGQLLTGTGVPANTRIISRISGTGGTGTYQTNARTVVSSTTITGTQGQLAKISSWG